jgi:hypothetical protein
MSSELMIIIHGYAEFMCFARGDIHTSERDPKLRATMILKKDTKRVTTAHVYNDGTVSFSNMKYNEVGTKGA